MQFKNLISEGPYPELFTLKPGIRCMRVKKSNKKLLAHSPSLSKWYDESLKVASAYVSYNTCIDAVYEFHDHNLLANSGPIIEQHVHTDFPFLENSH